MSEEREERAQEAEGKEDLQQPIIHTGAAAGNYDSNEDADARVRIEQPSGEEAPRAE